MRVLNLLTSGGYGGVEILCNDIAGHSKNEQFYCFLFGEGTIYERMKKNGYHVAALDDGKKLTIRRMRKLSKLAKNSDIIIVHHDDPFLEMHYLWLKKCYPRKKYISMVHHCYDPITDMKHYGLPKRVLKHWIVWDMFRKSDQLIFVSNTGYKSYCEDYNIDVTKVRIVYNGIGEDKLSAGEFVNKTSVRCVRMIYVGRLVELKGVDTLLAAFKSISKENECVLEVVGDGPCRGQLQEYVVKNDLQSKVFFHGFQQDVAPYLANADIFVYPSKTEIFGISIVEAMSFKCICVANAVGGIPEIINDGVNGFLNNQNDIEGLGVAVRRAVRILNNLDEKRKMMVEARKTAEKYTIYSTVEKLDAICDALMEKND